MSTKDKIGIMERRRALETARNVLYSKVGRVVLEENKFPDRTLELHKDRLDNESKKNCILIDNEKKMFKRSRLIYNLEPTILMERPASPQGHLLHKTKEDADQEIPHYMTDVKRPKTVIAIDMPPTIDAFTILKRKNKNIWETKYTEEDMTRKFRSIIMKSPPLTDTEYTHLDKGYELQRPVSKTEEDAKKRVNEKRRERIEMIQEAQRTPSPDAILTFITQLEWDAESRSTSRRTKSGATTANSQKPTIELKFNQRHLEQFEKIREKQKRKFFHNINI